MSSIDGLLETGTKLWLDSVDPELVLDSKNEGITGATSNPVIVADLIKSGRFDSLISDFANEGLDAESIAWRITDHLVGTAEKVFKPIFKDTIGDDGYVSFELDPLLEDPSLNLSLAERREKYVEYGLRWSKDHPNRMIKVPATEAGISALASLAAHGVPLNVTLIFSMRQYRAARDAIWEGAQSLKDRIKFKSVYSVFVSRVDALVEKQYGDLGSAKGLVGIVNAKLIWRDNHDFWADKNLPLNQEMVFASTGTKNKDDAPWKYVAALAGGDIQTNPPATNDAIRLQGIDFKKELREPVDSKLLSHIQDHIDFDKMETILLTEGVQKFVDPHKALISLIRQKFSID